MKTNIISIILILHTFGKVSTTDTGRILRNHLKKDNHFNSETEISFRHGVDRKTKQISKFTSDAVDPQCPDMEVIYPCSCSIDTTFGVAMDCSNVTTEIELQTIFENPFPQNDMYEFYMNQYNVNASIYDPPLGVFGSKTFVSVVLRNLDFSFSFNSFDHMNATLQSFYVYWIPIYTINHNFNAYSVLTDITLYHSLLTDFLISSPTLEYLYIQTTNITERADNSPYLFGAMPNLRELYFINNYLHKMPDTSGYPKLEGIYIYGNQIASTDGSLRTENYLDYLDAWENVLNDIPADSIRMSEGSELYLGTNQVEYLEEDVWRNIFLNVSAIHLHENPLDCSCVMAWIFGSDNNGTSFMEKMSGYEKCEDDGVFFKDLDPADYDNCTNAAFGVEYLDNYDDIITYEL